MVTTKSKRGYHCYGRPVSGLDIPTFRTALKWRGADLQTLRNTIRGPALPLGSVFERVSFEVGDGMSLDAALHRPETSRDLPVIILIHGLAGCEESPNIVSAAAWFLSLGYPVLRLNLRGAGPSADSSRGPYHGGLSDDLARVVDQVAEREYGAGIILYGISLGGNMMLKYLGECGADERIRVAIGVSAPLDLKSVQVRIMERRNRLYHNYLLLGMKNYAGQMAGRITGDLLAGAKAAKSLFDFDDKFTAPAHGMTGAEEYYRLHSARNFVGDIKTPTLLIHARNDPWIPVDDYLARDWPVAGAVSLVITDDGGHVGFHGRDNKVPWHERLAALYLDGARAGAAWQE